MKCPYCNWDIPDKWAKHTPKPWNDRKWRKIAKRHSPECSLMKLHYNSEGGKEAEKRRKFAKRVYPIRINPGLLKSEISAKIEWDEVKNK